MRRIDLGIGIFAIALGIFVLLASQELATFVRTAPGPGFLPRGLAIIFIISGIVLVIKQIVRPNLAPYERAEAGATQRIVLVFVLLTVVLLLLEPLGFILAALLLMAGLVFGIERKFNVASVATVILVPVIAWTLFAVLLRVRLPEGLLYF